MGLQLILLVNPHHIFSDTWYKHMSSKEVIAPHGWAKILSGNKRIKAGEPKRHLYYFFSLFEIITGLFRKSMHPICPVVLVL